MSCNLYYDLPNDILGIIDKKIHSLLLNDLHIEFNSAISNSLEISSNCFIKLRAFHEIFYYEDNLSDLKNMFKLQPNCPFLKNHIDTADYGLAWLYDYYQFDRVT